MLRGDGKEPVESQLIELRHTVLRVAAVDFVDDEKRPGRVGAKVLRDVAILRHHAARAVHDEENEVGLFHGTLCLSLDLRRVGGHRRIAVLEPARVGQLETPSVVELDHVRQPVARHARQVVDQRTALPGEAVEKRRLPDIRPADDDDVA